MNILKKSILILLTTAATLSAQSMDHDENYETDMQADREALVQVLDDFRTAIINGDQKKASKLLTGDARILESGGIETKEEYLSHHFHSDGKFLSVMQRKVTTQEVKTSGKTAWISTTSTMSGTYNESDVSLTSAELAVLIRTDDGWKIASVHWSSRSTK